jgi:uncharacterized membrane protein
LEHDHESAERRARALGWFSIALGLAGVIAPGRVARWIGAGERQNARLVLRAVGLREITCGIGLLSHTRTPAWAWARVAGDLMDVALLGSALGLKASERGKTVAAVASVLALAAVDSQTARDLRRPGRDYSRGIFVTQAITVNRSPEEVYRFWHDFENLPRFMSHLKSVHVVNGRSHWEARGPLGISVEWDAEVVEDRPGELIAWRSVAGADVPNRGSVRFRPAPGDRGTEIVVDLNYDPPAHALGAAVAKLFGENPSQQVAADLRHFKQVMETGEVLHSDSSIHRGMHAARPPRTLKTTKRGLSS